MRVYTDPPTPSPPHVGVLSTYRPFPSPSLSPRPSTQALDGRRFEADSFRTGSFEEIRRRAGVSEAARHRQDSCPTEGSDARALEPPPAAAEVDPPRPGETKVDARLGVPRVLFLLNRGTDIVRIRQYQRSYPEIELEAVWCFDPEAGLHLLGSHELDVVVAYVEPGGVWRPEVLRRLCRIAGPVPFLVLSSPAADREGLAERYSGVLARLSADSLHSSVFGLCLTYAHVLGHFSREPGHPSASINPRGDLRAHSLRNAEAGPR